MKCFEFPTGAGTLTSGSDASSLASWDQLRFLSRPPPGLRPLTIGGGVTLCQAFGRFAVQSTNVRNNSRAVGPCGHAKNGGCCWARRSQKSRYSHECDSGRQASCCKVANPKPLSRKGLVTLSKPGNKRDLDAGAGRHDRLTVHAVNAALVVTRLSTPSRSRGAGGRTPV